MGLGLASQILLLLWAGVYTMAGLAVSPDVASEKPSVAIEQSAKAEVQSLSEAELIRGQDVLARDLGLKNLSMTVDRLAFFRHATDGKQVSYPTALVVGLKTIFEDESSPETPLNIALAEIPWSTPGKLEIARKAAAQQILREQLDQPSTYLALYTGQETRQVALPPELGEDPARSWIFFLSIPSLSDHCYWIVVDKLGQKAAFVYGFN